MSVFSDRFPLGLGTSRLPVSGQDDNTGREKSVRLVLHALEAGVNYVDVGHNYSAGMALPVLKEAFHQTRRPVSITVKVMYGEDRTADDARRRVELYLREMDLPKAQFFTCWCIWTYQDFEKIMEKGGIYDGALRLKSEGLIDHICCSLHTSPEDAVKILESGVFEGATVSYSLLNAAHMRPVLDVARRLDVGIAVMNPLGGGVIARNRDFFSYACGDKDGEDTIRAALRFVLAHPAVNVVLGGVNSEADLESSLQAVEELDLESKEARLERVLARSAAVRGFCTGCKYCEGCPVGIPIYALMQARNALLFEPTFAYNRRGPKELLYNLQIFRRLFFDFDWLPEVPENPCVRCGHCEKVCTQRLGITDGVADIYERAKISGYSRSAHIKRLKELLVGKKLQYVGLYPSGGFARLIIRLYQEAFGKPDFRWLLFNSDPKTWGQLDGGLTIHAPSALQTLSPDLILIGTYRYDKEIMESLAYVVEMGIKVEKIHREKDVPWIF